jgi:hypothetical protein
MFRFGLAFSPSHSALPYRTNSFGINGPTTSSIPHHRPTAHSSWDSVACRVLKIWAKTRLRRAASFSSGSFSKDDALDFGKIAAAQFAEQRSMCALLPGTRKHPLIHHVLLSCGNAAIEVWFKLLRQVGVASQWRGQGCRITDLHKDVNPIS